MTRLRTLFALLLALAMLAAACGDDGNDSIATGPDTSEADSHDGDGDHQDDDHEDGDTDHGGDADHEDGDDHEAGDDHDGDTDPTEDEDTAPASTGDFPVTISTSIGDVVIESQPQRIVSLSPTATEVLFAIGAGDQVVAVDAFSNYPADAPVTDLSGWDPNVEAVLSYDPDLVVIANDANDLVAGLQAVGVNVLLSPAAADLEAGYASMADIGVATGHVDEAADAIAELRADIADALAAAPEVSLRIYHELDETYFSASSAGFIGAVYAAMGAENIADEADGADSGFPQLTEEYIVEADPQLIIITTQVSYTADDVAERPGWEQVSAVANGNIVVVDADTASRWGPRLPQFIEAVAEALTSASTTVG